MNNHPLSTVSSNINSGPLKIAGLYLLIGGLWILFSDRLAAQITSDPALLTRISIYKGWGYVLATALLLYWLIRREVMALHGGEEKLRLVTDALPALISYVDADKRYQFSNRAYEDWFGHQAQGKRLEEVLGTIAYKTISGYIDSALNGETVNYETEIPYKDGGTRFVNATYVPDLGTNGHVKGFFALVQDITESKQAEEEIRQWADAFEGCAHGIAIDDPSTNRIMVCNPAFARMHQCRVEDVVGSAILSLYAPPDHEHVRRSIERADQIGHSRFEARSARKDGSTFPVQMDVVSVWGEDGELLHRVATLVDISEQKGAEESLRESESNARSLLRLSKRLEQAQTYSEALDAALEEVKTVLGYQNVWTYLLSEDKQYLRLLTITGGKSQEVTGDFPTLTIKGDHFLEEIAQGQDIVLVEDARIDPRTNKDIVAQLGNRTIVNIPIILMDTNLGAFGTGSFGEEGVRIPTPTQLDYLRALASHMAVTLDRIHLLARRKLAEKDLHTSEERYRALVENALVGVYQTNFKGTFLFANPGLAQILNFVLPADLIGTKAVERYKNPQDLAHLLEILKREKRVRNFEMEWLTRDGQTKTVLLSAWLEHETLSGIVRDITDRKQAEERLRVSEEHFRQIVNTALDAVIGMDAAGRITQWNAQAEAIFGWSYDKVQGQSLAETIIPPDLRDMHRRGLRHFLETGEGPVLTRRIEIMALHRNGETFPVELAITPLKSAGTYTFSAFLRDITERKRVEEKLRKSEELFSKAFHGSPAPMTIARQTDGTYIEVNKSFLHMVECDREEVIGHTSLELNLIDTDGRAEIIRQFRQQGAIHNIEVQAKAKSGRRLDVLTSIENTELAGEACTITTMLDITERKLAEEALQKAHDELELKVQERTAALSQANTLLQALMDYMPDHIYFKDTQSRFIRNSKSQANMLGLSDPTQIVGKTDFDFFPHAAQAYAEEQEVMRTGQALVDFEERVVWPDSRETWVSTTKVPLRTPDGQIIGIFGISRDITERKRGEQAIQQLNADLKNQAAQLETANKELEAFSYSVSHDLRAPLRAIDGFTRILFEDYEPMLDEEGKRVCKIISREAQHMGQLIDDLLAFSRLGRKEMRPTKIDMKAMAGSVFDELVATEDAERIGLHVHRLPLATGDATLIRQVWVNLLSNAIKFSSKKERAVIEVGSKYSENEHIYYVRDNGAGFDLEYVDKLFGVFQRLHSEKEFTGTGVGLAIVKRVINRHGGRVWAEGQVDKGATFYFSLPRKRE